MQAQTIRTFRIAVLLLAGGVLSQIAVAKDRGRMLYETHCIACHSTQVHWREKLLAKDWDSLRKQVNRWQSNAALNWAEQDIGEVARYLNERYYRFDEPAARLVETTPTH